MREIWRALRLDATYDKDQILEAYLNVISFTGNTAGVEAECIKLFGKSASELSLAQCATIAAITKNPTRYDPCLLYTSGSLITTSGNVTLKVSELKEIFFQNAIIERYHHKSSVEKALTEM